MVEKIIKRIKDILDNDDLISNKFIDCYKKGQKDERQKLAEYIENNNSIDSEYKKILLEHLEL